MNLIAKECEYNTEARENILVGYFSGACKEYYAAGCLLYLNREDPTADVGVCFDKHIPMDGVCVDSKTVGFTQLLNEPDLVIGDIIVAVVEENIGPEHQWVANKIWKLDQCMFGSFMSQLKDLNPELVKIPEPMRPRRLKVKIEE